MAAWMTRGWFALLVLVLVVPPTVVFTTADAAARPNIILIVTDDQTATDLQQMPRTRQLLQEEGLSFANFLVSTPLCCPSRASILRGQYTGNHGVLTNSGPNGGYQAFRALGLERSTIGAWLQDEGYRTALIGKYLNGYGEGQKTNRVPPGWTEWDATTSQKYFDYDLVENGDPVHYGKARRDYLTDVLSKKAQDFIEDAVARNQPFFLYLTPKAPHGPATPAPRHEGLFDGVKQPRTLAFNEADVSDKPGFVRDTPPLTRSEIREIDALYRDRLRSLQAVDEMVAKLVRTLESSGTLANTYIFFTSDNGYLLGEHRRVRKGMAYEEAIRVPLLVRGPGVATGTVEEMASMIDLAPTVAELAGAPAPGFVDGRSLSPLFDGAAPDDWRQALLVETFSRDDEPMTALEIENGPSSPPFQALRLRDRVYVEYPETGERELYDLRADPMELENLANDPERGQEIAALHDWLDVLLACEGQACRDAEDAPPGKADGASGRARIPQPASSDRRVKEARRAA